jgi:hypothetical protein
MNGAKKHTKIIIATLDWIPKPSAAIRRGATAMRGVASITIMYGCKKRRIVGLKPTKLPRLTPAIEPPTNPKSTNPIVTHKWCQMLAFFTYITQKE